MTEEINAFSERSKKLIADMGITEIFELCETSSKIQWQIGIVYCSCGRSLKPSQKTKQFDKKNCDALSIPGYVIKKSLTHGAKHGASERQRMYNKAQEMLQKARQPKHGDSKTILERWHKDDDYHKSLSDIGWTEEQNSPVRQNCTGRPTPKLQCNHRRKELATRKIGYSR